MEPMLAGTAKNYGNIKYPVIASPKLDGIRVLIHPTLGPVTRSLKPVPNNFIRGFLSDPALHYLDGEVVVGNHGAADAFNATQSGVMSVTGEPDFTYIVFDSFQSPNLSYLARLGEADRSLAISKPLLDRIVMIENTVLGSYMELMDYEERVLSEGYEGVMFRSPDGLYKFGRSTEREAHLVKMKQLADAEAEIIGFEWLQHNMNAATTNALGRTERSSHKDGKVANKWMIGALQVRGLNGTFEGVEFKIGTGFTEEQRRELAFMEDRLVGKFVNFSYQEEGSKDAPRFPRFKGFRDARDMS